MSITTKKSLLLIAAAVCAVCICSCSKDKNTETEKQTLAMNDKSYENNIDVTETSEEAYIPNSSSENKETAAASDENKSTQQLDKTNSTIYSEDKPTSAQIVPENSADKGTSAQTSEIKITDAKEIADNVFGVQGKTDAEWLAFGQELYKEGCDTAFRFLCTGSQFPFDMQNLEIIDKTYFLTTCNSFDEATEPYYKIFSREYHLNDFDGLLTQSGGRLYAARSARGMDITYLSSEVDKLIKATDTEIIFSVITEYEDGETTSEFTLVLDDGEWKIGKFTLPY